MKNIRKQRMVNQILLIVHLLEVFIEILIAYVTDPFNKGFACIELRLRNGRIVMDEPAAFTNGFEDNWAEVRRRIDTKLGPKPEADINPIPAATTLTRNSAIKRRSDAETLIYVTFKLV